MDLHWRDWGADSVAFEAQSGQLFQFDPLTAAVLASIEQQEGSVNDIASALLADLPDADPHELRAAVTGVIEHVQQLGWVTPIMPR